MGDALLEPQGENIPAIQEVDAIIDQRRHRQIVCECKVHPRS